MVRLNYIIRIINEDVKCRATARAKNIGKTATWQELKVEEGKWETLGLSPADDRYYKVSYDDGTEIYFDIEGTVTHLNCPNLDFDENYLGVDSYDFFKKQKNAIIKYFNSDIGDALYNNFAEYCDLYASWEGMRLNRYLRGIDDFDDFRFELGSDFDVLWGREGAFHEDFCNVVKNNDLSVYDDFFSWRQVDHLHDNDSLDKRIVWDKAHTCASVGMTDEKFKDIFVSDEAWSIFTLHKKGDKSSRGVFMGNAINEARGDSFWGGSSDWEMEMHYAPNQKFERVIIDEKSKLIVQVPYEP